jgi:hypothetical protein
MAGEFDPAAALDAARAHLAAADSYVERMNRRHAGTEALRLVALSLRKVLQVAYLVEASYSATGDLLPPVPEFGARASRNEGPRLEVPRVEPEELRATARAADESGFPETCGLLMRAADHIERRGAEWGSLRAAVRRVLDATIAPPTPWPDDLRPVADAVNVLALAYFRSSEDEYVRGETADWIAPPREGDIYEVGHDRERRVLVHRVRDESVFYESLPSDGGGGSYNGPGAIERFRRDFPDGPVARMSFAGLHELLQRERVEHRRARLSREPEAAPAVEAVGAPSAPASSTAGEAPVGSQAEPVAAGASEPGNTGRGEDASAEPHRQLPGEPMFALFASWPWALEALRYMLGELRAHHHPEAKARIVAVSKAIESFEAWRSHGLRYKGYPLAFEDEFHTRGVRERTEELRERFVTPLNAASFPFPLILDEDLPPGTIEVVTGGQAHRFGLDLGDEEGFITYSPVSNLETDEPEPPATPAHFARLRADMVSVLSRPHVEGALVHRSTVAQWAIEMRRAARGGGADAAWLAREMTRAVEREIDVPLEKAREWLDTVRRLELGIDRSLDDVSRETLSDRPPICRECGAEMRREHGGSSRVTYSCAGPRQDPETGEGGHDLVTVEVGDSAVSPAYARGVAARHAATRPVSDDERLSGGVIQKPLRVVPVKGPKCPECEKEMALGTHAMTFGGENREPIWWCRGFEDKRHSLVWCEASPPPLPPDEDELVIEDEDLPRLGREPFERVARPPRPDDYEPGTFFEGFFGDPQTMPAWTCRRCGQRNSGWSRECGRCYTIRPVQDEPVCDDCWLALKSDREPVRLTAHNRAPCVICGSPTDGIILRLTAIEIEGARNERERERAAGSGGEPPTEAAPSPADSRRDMGDMLVEAHRALQTLAKRVQGLKFNAELANRHTARAIERTEALEVALAEAIDYITRNVTPSSPGVEHRTATLLGVLNARPEIGLPEPVVWPDPLPEVQEAFENWRRALLHAANMIEMEVAAASDFGDATPRHVLLAAFESLAPTATALTVMLRLEHGCNEPDDTPVDKAIATLRGKLNLG